MKLEDIKTEKDLAKYEEYLKNKLSNKEITDQDDYNLYNAAFEKVYGHPAYDENGNFYK